MEKWLAPNPPFAASEDCTDEREWILVDGDKAVPPLTTTPHFPSRFATAHVCLIARATSISACKCFFDAICSVLLAYNAQHLSSYSLGIEEVQMTISPYLIFNTWQIACDWCLGKDLLSHHLYNQPSFHSSCWYYLWWRENEKILAKGSKVVSSPPPLFTNKSQYQNL